MDDYAALVGAVVAYLLYWVHRGIISLMNDGPTRTSYQKSIRLLPWFCAFLVVIQIAKWIMDL